MNVPNALTLFRIVLIPFLIVAISLSFRNHEFVALGIFLLATFTDSVDGFWARRTNQITAFGQLLDPIADKLLVASAMICLVATGAVPAWMAVVIVGREIAITGFRAIAASKGLIIAASRLGKLKMIMETVAIALLIAGKNNLGNWAWTGRAGLWIVLVLAVYSAAEYFWKYGPALLRSGSAE